MRVALAADFASPFANAGEKGLGFINSDVTLYLHRLPVTKWIGFDVVNHQASAGIAIGECWLYDEAGADRHLDGRSAGAAQADDERAAAVALVIPGHPNRWAPDP